MIELRVMPVGEYQTNCYLIVETELDEGILIDPGDEAQKILDWIGKTSVTRLLLTHGHSDHVGALHVVKQSLGATVGIHPADAEAFSIQADFELSPGNIFRLGDAHIEVVHVPGHTPGSVALKLIEVDGFHRALSGDAIFPGGPGHTQTPEALAAALESLAHTIFTWPDSIRLHPGHGESTTVGRECAAFETFRDKPLPPDLCGDVTWG
ncbi:MAG: MBL fold metallo-hydrolase [Anaerolineales bacterium]|nr:MAG: MBL fold metallo-hydrolase [Anaerolineales bacterium]